MCAGDARVEEREWMESLSWDADMQEGDRVPDADTRQRREEERQRREEEGQRREEERQRREEERQRREEEEEEGQRGRCLHRVR